MPHIFPRRFLRTRDILDPSDFNEDIQPVHDLLAANLDRTNFNANSLKNDLRPGPTSVTPETTGPCVAEGAYFNVHTTQIESTYPVYGQSGFLVDDYTFRPPPNFVKLDEATFRRTYAGTDSDGYPSIIPNSGAWTAVKNADLSGSQQINFVSGQTQVWVCAYAQYIWQGFFEYKSPYVPGDRKFTGVEVLDAPEPGDGLRSTWAGNSQANLALDEATALNNFYPSAKWESLPNEATENRLDNLNLQDESYSWPLNEDIYPDEEYAKPNRQGYHHISEGHTPCRIQFAIRVDGKILEETITGKRLPFEESAHGLQVTNSTPRKGDGDLGDVLIGLGLSVSDSWLGTIFGQKSFVGTSFYDPDTAGEAPGQKLKSTRAVAYGPEVMPVRLGAVVSLEPGDHTIELVARRLEPKSDMFVKGDVVGVFSRRMLAFDLPINAIRQDSAGDNASPLTDFSRFETPGFMPEDKLTNDNISGSRDILASTLNSVQGSNIGTNVFSSEYLPSKVVYSETDSLSPDIEINEFTGRYEAHGEHANTSKAILPHPDDLSLTNNILTSSSDGWYPGSDAEFDENNVGWFQLNNGPSKLGFAASGLSVKPSEKLILMMDVELLGIHPIYSTGANYVRTSVFMNSGLAGGGILTRELYSKYGSYLLAERYLDLFASFAIGYKQGGSWKIGQAAVPTLTNSFNWTNRSPLFDNNGDVIPMTAHGVATENFWEVPSDWDGYDRSDLTELYHNGEITAMPAGILPGFFESLGPKGKSNGRGDRLFPSNLGVNIPVMLVIENTTTVDLDITEIGGFVSSYVPDIWMRGYGPLKVRKYGEVVTVPSSIVPGGLDIVTGDKDLPFQWASPVGGRDILDGVTVRWGGAKLSAIKVTK